MNGWRSSSDKFLHISPRIWLTSVFFKLGCLFLSSERRPWANSRKALIGLLGADGSFRARFQGTCHGPVYVDFSAMYLCLSLAATSSQCARSWGVRAFHFSPERLDTVITVALSPSSALISDCFAMKKQM
jgi:hypothetical protein